VSEQPARDHATIEMLLVALDDPSRSDSLIDELGALHRSGIVRVIDLVLVAREPDGAVRASGHTELSEDEAEETRRFVGDALGLQTGDRDFGPTLDWEGGSVLLGAVDIRLIARNLYPGRAALAIVFEHRWATRLGRLLHRRGVSLLEDDVLTPQLLTGMGTGTSIW
jgi:hypothetical protein